MEVLSVRSSPRRLAAACLLPMFVVLLCSAPAQAARTDCSPEPSWPGQDAASAAEVVRLVNAYRGARGLSQLQLSQSLTNAAAWKASELAIDVPATNGAAFSHSDYGTNRTPEARLQACGYGDAFGENIALGQASPQAVMDAWIASPGHRANLEYPAWTAIGVGAAGGAWGYGWVQDFGVSNPDPIITPLASLAPTPSATAPTTAVPLANPLEAPPAATLVAAAAPSAAAPDVEIMARPRSRTRLRTARIRWVISGQMQRLSCSLNGKALRRCGATGRTLHVRRGRHVFRVTATGPMGTDTKQVRWRVVRG
jgi:uncharacterized protein YkwD